MRLEGKVALISGASVGIGEAIAKRFAREGAAVAINYKSNDDGATRVMKSIMSDGGIAKLFKADVSKVPEIEQLQRSVIDEFGRIDILVNNAGVFRTVPVLETTEEIWDEQLDLNLRGYFFMVKTLVPHFLKNGGGKVISISSIAGTGAFPNCPGYCASKGGVVNMTKATLTGFDNLQSISEKYSSYKKEFERPRPAPLDINIQPTSPSYVPTSPSYVPTSPSYVPKSPDYGPPKPEESEEDYQKRVQSYDYNLPKTSEKSPDFGPPKPEESEEDYQKRVQSPDYNLPKTPEKSPDYGPPKSPDYTPPSNVASGLQEDTKEKATQIINIVTKDIEADNKDIINLVNQSENKTDISILNNIAEDDNKKEEENDKKIII